MRKSEPVQAVSFRLDSNRGGTYDRPVAGIYDLVHAGWHPVNYHNSCALDESILGLNLRSWSRAAGSFHCRPHHLWSR